MLKKIRAAMDENFTYHCPDGKAFPSMLKGSVCNGEHAHTEDRGNVYMCFNVVSGWKVPAAAWVIAHEQYHRAFGPAKHHWRPAGGHAGCSGDSPRLSDTAKALVNPDSYACLASRCWSDRFPPPKKKSTP